MQPKSPFFDILLSRLTWPSVVVREKACSALASLMRKPGFENDATNTILAWIAQQPLESVASIGLLVLAQAQIQGADLPPWSSVVAAIKKPSLLSWLISRELYGPAVSDPVAYDFYSGTAPETFTADAFFTQYVRIFLPEIYLLRCRRIDERTGNRFIKQWSFEWKRLLKVVHVELKRPSSYFWKDPNGDHFVWDLPMSEIYRSSFLRALGWAVHKNVLDLRIATLFAAEACPVDLGLWRVKPTEKPGWWPTCPSPNGSIDQVPGLITSKLTELWERERNSEWAVVEASGRVQESHNATYDIDIVGVIQSCHGPERPEIEEVIAGQDSLEGVTTSSPRLLVLGGHYPHESDGDWERRYSDWSVWQLAAPARLIAIDRWQHWRSARGVWLPAPFLAPDGFNFACTPDFVSISSGETEKARWSDWTYCLQEPLCGNLPPSTGQALRLHQSLIDDAQRRLGGTFAWLCQIRAYQRKHVSGPFDVARFAVDFGTTSVVRDSSAH